MISKEDSGHEKTDSISVIAGMCHCLGHLGTGRNLYNTRKLMCYYRVSVHWGEWIEQPTPEQVAEIIDKIMDNHSAGFNMLFPDKDALIQFEWDCMNLSIYNPDEEMRELLEQIAWSEGMFFRQAAE